MLAVKDLIKPIRENSSVRSTILSVNFNTLRQTLTHYNAVNELKVTE